VCPLSTAIRSFAIFRRNARNTSRPVTRVWMAILHVNALAEARQFEEQLRASLSCPDTIMMAELTPGLSIYGGTGLVEVALVAGREEKG
jgi:hypothetical protein